MMRDDAHGLLKKGRTLKTTYKTTIRVLMTAVKRTQLGSAGSNTYFE